MLNLRNFYKVIVSFLLLSTSLFCKPYENLFKLIDETPRSSIEGIDGIYVINLDVRPEKWHRLEPMLYYHGVDCIRFAAIFGWEFDVPTTLNYCTKHMRMGQVACMLSHLSIYQEALNQGLKVIWVMEDDSEFLRDPQVLTEIITELDEIDPEWDVLYTDLDFIKKDGTYVRSLAFPVDKADPFPHPLSYYTYRKNISKNLQLLRSRYGTGSMIMSERGMKKAVDHFTTYDDILWPYDIEFHYIPTIRQYGIRNPVVINGHFSYNSSDTAARRIKNYYEIDEEHIQYLEERFTLLGEIVDHWLKYFRIDP